ncbi:MAG: D-alanyl-D-alanine carboxypeptidase, partial [Labilithrix sp.]|nr:D-alanyl-D-alanine carboxypeptidase [Labilithrix sp.]
MRAVRRLLLGLAASLLVLSGGGGSARSQPTPTPAAASEGRASELEAAVRALVNDRALKDAQIGVVVMDADNGNILAQSGEHVVLNPASNAKLYTAAGALALLKGTHRYQTTLSGSINGNNVSSLVIRGHGDPSLRTRDLWQMVAELKARGVRRIDGDIFVEQKFFDEQTTPPAFEQQPNEWAAFRAPVSAVALNGNTVTL